MCVLDVDIFGSNRDVVPQKNSEDTRRINEDGMHKPMQKELLLIKSERDRHLRLAIF